MLFSTALLVSTLLTRIIATPVSNPEPDRVVLAKRATCTPATLGNDQLDDTPAIYASIQACKAGGTIV